MKQSLLIFLSVFLLTATANTAQAFNAKDLQKLKQTKECPKCDLRSANLSRAKLIGADLREADLRSANLTGAYLRGADLSGATWIDGRTCAKGSTGKCN